MINKNIATHFWSKVKQGLLDECWTWQACRFPKGYGCYSIEGKTARAHRIAYELTKGAIPKGLIVRHTCDNPPCCNPNHLLLGTNKDNTQDAIQRGRLKPIPRYVGRGETAQRAKLTNEQARELRRLYESNQLNKADLSRKYGITSQAVSKIVQRITYRDA